MRFLGKTFPRIKPDRSRAVKPALLSAFAAFALLIFALPAEAAGETGLSLPEPLPEIEARTFDIQSVRKSRNNHVVLFQAKKESIPPVGRLLLLKRDGSPYVAVRVLKTYVDTDTFAAKVLRHYDAQSTINPRDSFLAIEKISDVIAPAPTLQDKADIKEVEAPPALAEPLPSITPSAVPEPVPSPEPSPELLPEPESSPSPDASSFPAIEPSAAPPTTPALEELTPEPIPSPSATPEPDSQELEATDDPAPQSEKQEPEQAPEEDEELLGQAVDEMPVLDPFRNWVSSGFGLMKNGDGYYAGGGARYGYTIKRTPFVNKAKVQDSIALEGAIFYYKVLNTGTVTGGGDSFSVIPITGTIRYSLALGETMGAFFYAGFVRNFATRTSTVGTDETANLLSGLNADGSGLGLVPAFGTGLTFRVGPQWDMRFDIGYDIVGMSLMLRF